MIEKTAAALEKLSNENQALEEEVTKMEKQAQRNNEAFEKLIKMAKAKEIDWGEVPEKLAALTNMEEEEYQLEIRAMEKAASGEYLNFGDLGETKNSNVDPLTDFIVENRY